MPKAIFLKVWNQKWTNKQTNISTNILLAFRWLVIAFTSIFAYSLPIFCLFNLKKIFLASFLTLDTLSGRDFQEFTFSKRSELNEWQSWEEISNMFSSKKPKSEWLMRSDVFIKKWKHSWVSLNQSWFRVINEC